MDISLADGSGKSIKSASVKVDANGEAEVEWDFTIGNHVELWWPVGQGKQPLYKVSAELKLQVRRIRKLFSITRRFLLVYQ